MGLIITFILYTAIECTAVPTFTNGIVVYSTDTTPDYELTTTVNYSCNDGFFLDTSDNSNKIRTCVNDIGNDAEGEWSGEAPTCVREYKKHTILCYHLYLQYM